ncbi:MAG: hypothetical protein Q8N23_31725 [Archangium sp.]|nr:hypothetical protein [Archangium sp.]MDP3571123.1 hypothetical protein [Archangium sp.]
MRAAVWVAVSFIACGPLTPPKMDGGGGGGNVTGGGGGVTGGGSGGGATGGGGTTTGGGAGGGAMDAGDGIWDFSSVALNPTPVNSAGVVGFAETDAGLYAVSSSGRLYRSTGGAFTELFAFPGLQPADFEGTASGHLFILSTVHFLECDSDCGDAGSWTDRQISASNEALDSLCVIDSAHVLAIGSRGSANDGIAYRWNGATLATAASLLGVAGPDNCWQSASGDFFIPAHDTVLRYSPSTEGFTPELTMTPMRGWRGGGSSPGHEWVTGVGPVIAERGQSSWSNVFAPTGTSGSSIVSVVGISPTLAFAFGAGGTSAGQAGYRFDGSRWSAMNPDVPVLNGTYSTFRASNGVVYVGGYDGNQAPVIIRAARR